MALPNSGEYHNPPYSGHIPGKTMTPTTEHKKDSLFRIPAHEMKAIASLLGREPNLTEEAIFSAMWSEHCSYKSSRKHLRKFQSHNPRVVSGPGENAGIIHIGEGIGIAFKMESHNHPSFLEPFQGAATGVGGILRDIFAMGARPVALANSLVFGSLRHPRHRTLFRRVVAGIAGYGNPVGIPTVAGEVWFDDRYLNNILVNVFALGVVNINSVMSAKAPKEGLVAVYMGNRTGRDGVSGAAMASRGFTSSDGDLRPQVQVADPYVGKNLIEATLRIIQENLPVAVQDMGAAGLTSSSTEMAGRGGLGMELDLSSVPLRETQMEGWEILLSESQERMLFLSEPEQVERILQIARDYQLSASVVGRTITDPTFRVKMENRILAEIPIELLTDKAPVYDRPADVTPPIFLTGHIKAQTGSHAILQSFKEMISHPNGGDTKWIHQQFDKTVGGATLMGPGHDGAVVNLKSSKKSSVAIALASLPHTLSRDAYKGACNTVLKAVTDLSAMGAIPLGMTDCLNFGNPENPIVMGQLSDAISGIADMGAALEIPVVSGNVSLYNETNKQSIPPTPMIVITGRVSDYRNRIPGITNTPGLTVSLLGSSENLSLGGSFLEWISGDSPLGPVPEPDPSFLKRIVKLMAGLSSRRLINCSRSVGKGGILRSLLMMTLGSIDTGVIIRIPDPIEPLSYFFSESPGRILIAHSSTDQEEILQWSREMGVTLQTLGTTVQKAFSVRYRDLDGQEKHLSESPQNLKNLYMNAITQFMEDAP